MSLIISLKTLEKQSQSSTNAPMLLLLSCNCSCIRGTTIPRDKWSSFMIARLVGRDRTLSNIIFRDYCLSNVVRSHNQQNRGCQLKLFLTKPLRSRLIIKPIRSSGTTASEPKHKQGSSSDQEPGLTESQGEPWSAHV